MAAAKTSNEKRATAWLSRDLTQVAYDLALHRARPDNGKADFDVLIVGSGYGGAMALYELAGRTSNGAPLQIAMVERGNEYLPGAFPTRMADLPGCVRFSTAGRSSVGGVLDGLFDLRLGSDVNVLQANGLGGGSLINAGVMAQPGASVLIEPCWPKRLRDDPPSPEDFLTVAGDLRASSAKRYTGRAQAMSILGGSTEAEPASVTVAAADEPRRGIKKCIQCGDCASGCNFGAKLSLDVTLIADACEKHAKDCTSIITGATVTTVSRIDSGGWKVFVVHTDPHLRARQGDAYTIRARYLVIAAGSLGSTELLLRARTKGLWVSPMLGERFSANGDNISALYEMGVPVKGSAKEDEPYDTRAVGPTITRIVDLRDEHNFVIEDLAIPGPLRRMFEEVLTTGMMVRSLNAFDCNIYRGGKQPPDPAGIDGEALDRSMTVATIGRDRGDGRLAWPQGNTACAEEGRLGVSWPAIHDEGRLDENQKAFEALAAENKLTGKVLRNPMWRPLPGTLDKLFGPIRGAAFTVHPLGGCIMGDTGATGVVNDLGQVFQGVDDAVYPDLVVLDGSIVPCSLGINPALTIATLTRRAVHRLCRSDKWNFDCASSANVELPTRPRFRQVSTPAKAAPTSIQMTERMRTTATIESNGECATRLVEIELRFHPIDVTGLIGNDSPRQLCVDPDHSRLRISGLPPKKLDEKLGNEETARLNAATEPPPAVWLETPLSGTLTLMRHEPSIGLQRMYRGLVAWFCNRGLRDGIEYLTERFCESKKHSASTATIGELLGAAFRLASRAGDVRLLEYRLELGEPFTPPDHSDERWEGATIEAVKRLTYERAGNPVNQLQQATMRRFPNWRPAPGEEQLSVDLPFFAQAGVPLLRIFSQANQPNALVDLTSLGLYILRVLLPLHAWTMRLPDRPLARVANRLPANVPGLPTLAFVELDMPPPDGLESVRLRLSRYRPRDCDNAKVPVMLIHGYSASGTTFVHPALCDGGLVGALCAEKRDVWVLDLRSSCGMPTAHFPWKFEEMGYQDIPLAVDYVCSQTGHERIDIVAHCMGAAMLSLGLFPNEPIPKDVDCCAELRKALPTRIRRLVLSQVGPAVVMSPANTARAYIMQWLQHYLNLGPFELTPPAAPSAVDMIDRLLSIVPYPRSDFFRENPKWPPCKRTRWVGTRHRMDSLYGVTFKLDGVDDTVLDAIDDFFGPMSLKTVAQVILFARSNVVCNIEGKSMVWPGNVQQCMDFPVLSLHSSQNGLVDIRTRRRLIALLLAAKVDHESIELPDMGHQDSLIGKNATNVFKYIIEFLGR